MTGEHGHFTDSAHQPSTSTANCCCCHVNFPKNSIRNTAFIDQFRVAPTSKNLIQVCWENDLFIFNFRTFRSFVLKSTMFLGNDRGGTVGRVDQLERPPDSTRTARHRRREFDRLPKAFSNWGRSVGTPSRVDQDTAFLWWLSGWGPFESANSTLARARTLFCLINIPFLGPPVGLFLFHMHARRREHTS